MNYKDDEIGIKKNYTRGERELHYPTIVIYLDQTHGRDLLLFSLIKTEGGGVSVRTCNPEIYWPSP